MLDGVVVMKVVRCRRAQAIYLGGYRLFILVPAIGRYKKQKIDFGYGVLSIDSNCIIR